MQAILEFDQWLFFLINQSFDIAVLDWLLPYWRTKETWIPLYLFLVVFSIWKFKKVGIYFVLAALLTVGITDTISNRVLKQTIQRVRPCNDLTIKKQVDLLVRCGSGYSFTSNHAANHFGLAAFFVWTIGLVYRKTRFWWWFWAATIAFGQVYVGVHYPLDVIGGAFLGIFIGWSVAILFNRNFSLLLKN